MLIFLTWLFFAIIVGVAANTRGRSGFAWFLLAVVISPLIAGLFVIALPRLKSDEVHVVNTAGRKKCPYCAEWIRREAIACRYCGRDLPTTIEARPIEPRFKAEPAAVTVYAPTDAKRFRPTDGTPVGSLTFLGVTVLIVAAFIGWAIYNNPPPATQASSGGGPTIETPPYAEDAQTTVTKSESAATSPPPKPQKATPKKSPGPPLKIN